MIRTYLDTGILITAFKGSDGADVCFRLFDDDNRQFVSSLFLKLELLFKPAFIGRVEECQYYENFFRHVSDWLITDDQVLECALEQASQHDIDPMDALHLAAAHCLRADELITTEKQGKPLHRSTLLKVTSLDEYRS